MSPWWRSAFVRVGVAAGRFISGQGDSQPVESAMNRTIGIQLAVYSLLLAGLSYLVHHLAPTIARPTLITGLAGGALCLAWAVRAVLGKRGKALPILTLIPICYVLLGQAIMVPTGQNLSLPGERTAVAVIGLLFFLSMGIVVRIAWAGVAFGQQPPNPRKEGDGQPQPSERRATQAKAGKRA